MEPPTFCVPPELMDDIWHHLDVPSRGCLASTCKDAYAYWKPVFEHPILKPSALDDTCSDINIESPAEIEYYRGRAQFMKQIQTAQHVYCQSCDKLHLADEFEEAELQIHWRVTLEVVGSVPPSHSVDDQIFISHRDKRLPTLPGRFVGSCTCSITPFNTIERQSGKGDQHPECVP